jgi:hypothetical protein
MMEDVERPHALGDGDHECVVAAAVDDGDGQASVGLVPQQADVQPGADAAVELSAGQNAALGHGGRLVGVTMRAPSRAPRRRASGLAAGRVGSSPRRDRGRYAIPNRRGRGSMRVMLRAHDIESADPCQLER